MPFASSAWRMCIQGLQLAHAQSNILMWTVFASSKNFAASHTMFFTALGKNHGFCQFHLSFIWFYDNNWSSFLNLSKYAFFIRNCIARWMWRLVLTLYTVSMLKCRVVNFIKRTVVFSVPISPKVGVAWLGTLIPYLFFCDDLMMICT